jgi:hypothetical protein
MAVLVGDTERLRWKRPLLRWGEADVGAAVVRVVRLVVAAGSEVRRFPKRGIFVVVVVVVGKSGLVGGWKG